VRTLFVAPRLSAALLVVWLLLNNTAEAAHVLLGGLIAIVTPLILFRRSPVRPFRGYRTVAAIRLAARVAVDIVRSNLELAIRIIGSEAKLQPRYVWVPISLRSPAGIAVLSSIITLTPGTLSVNVGSGGQSLLVHVFDLDSESQLVTDITVRYEQLIAEIFE
jgi:multicomponent K+:H+ antiporter subunit E